MVNHELREWSLASGRTSRLIFMHSDLYDALSETTTPAPDTVIEQLRHQLRAISTKDNPQPKLDFNEALLLQRMKGSSQLLGMRVHSNSHPDTPRRESPMMLSIFVWLTFSVEKPSATRVPITYRSDSADLMATNI